MTDHAPLELMRTRLIQLGKPGKGGKARKRPNAADGGDKFTLEDCRTSIEEATMVLVAETSISTLGSSSTDNVSAGERQNRICLGFEVLALVLQRCFVVYKDGGAANDDGTDGQESDVGGNKGEAGEASQLSDKKVVVAEVESLLDESLQRELSRLIWIHWESPTATILHKIRAALEALITISTALPTRCITDLPQTDDILGGQNSGHLVTAPALQTLLGFALSSPLGHKRTITVITAVLPYLPPQVFTARYQNPLAAILNEMDSNEVVVPLGRLGIEWIKKVLPLGKQTGESSFEPALKPIFDAFAETAPRSQRIQSNICSAILPSLFKLLPETFDLLLAHVIRLQDPTPSSIQSSSVRLLSIISIARVGNASALLSRNDPEFASLLSTDLLQRCLLHSSGPLRVSALNLICSNVATTSQIPPDDFRLLRQFFTYNFGETDPSLRQEMLSATYKLFGQIRDSSYAAWREQQKLIQIDDREATRPLTEYLDQVRDYLVWFTDLVIVNLDPAKPYRCMINALKILQLILQSGFDPTCTSALDLSLNSRSSFALNRKGSGVPFPIPIQVATPQLARALLELLLGTTFNDIRHLAAAFLWKVPSPFFDVSAGQKNLERDDLLDLAVEMLLSKREVDTDAGAAVIARFWHGLVSQFGSELDLERSLARLGQTRSWLSDKSLSAPAYTNRSPLRLIHHLMAFADLQAEEALKNLTFASQEAPLAGTLGVIRDILASTSKEVFESIASASEWRKIFLQVLDLVEKTWLAAKPVLSNEAPEGSGAGQTVLPDHEEARALKFVADEDDEDDADDADVTTGSSTKVILSMAWRAMKEAGDLLRIIVERTRHFGNETMREIWTLTDLQRMGGDFSSWLLLIRHRGAFSSLCPSYSKFCSVLLSSSWPEAAELPATWLEAHLDDILSKNVSITRRSAGIPFLVLAILSNAMPDSPLPSQALSRLFEMAETVDGSVPDDARIHAMNTLKTLFLDGDMADAARPFVERGFALAIRSFWSPNWSIRNVSLLLYASLINRSLGAKKHFGPLNAASIAKRCAINDFFIKHPALHPILLAELATSARENLHDLPTSDPQSSLYSVLLLLSLLQTQDGPSGKPVASPFVPQITVCAKSRVWRVRDAAAYALTGVVAPGDIAATCLSLLNNLQLKSLNEIHGVLLMVTRLLEGAPRSAGPQSEAVLTQLEDHAGWLLDSARPFPLRSAVVDATIAALRLAPNKNISRVSSIVAACRNEVERISSPARMAPGQPAFISTCARLLLTEQDASFVSVCLTSAHGPAKEEALQMLKQQTSDNEGGIPEMPPPIVQAVSAIAFNATGTMRALALDVLAHVGLNAWIADIRKGHDQLVSEYRTTAFVPLKERLLPIMYGFVSETPDDRRTREIASFVAVAASDTSSEETRLAAAHALGTMLRNSPSMDGQTLLILINLLEDDDPIVREAACQVASDRLGQGVTTTRAMEALFFEIHGENESDLYRLLLDLDGTAKTLEELRNPSGVLFLTEKLNQFSDVAYLVSLIRQRFAMMRDQDLDDYREDQWKQRAAQLLSLLESLQQICTDGAKATSQSSSIPLGLTSMSLFRGVVIRLVAAFDAIDSALSSAIPDSLNQIRPFVDQVRACTAIR